MPLNAQYNKGSSLERPSLDFLNSGPCSSPFFRLAASPSTNVRVEAVMEAVVAKVAVLPPLAVRVEAAALPLPRLPPAQKLFLCRALPANRRRQLPPMELEVAK